jgi:4-carboxymuconolactone decarboxylase
VDDAARTLVLLSAQLAGAGRGELRAALLQAERAAGAEAVEEALLQSYLFLGYPAALRALAEWRAASGAPAPAEPTADEAEWAARGAATCQRVYGGQYDSLRRNIAALHPDMERWMVLEGYGKVLSRPGLGLAVRELCVVALLAGQDALPQLYSHLRGALNAGASRAAVDETVALLVPLLEPAQAARVQEQWQAVCRRADGG